MVRRIMYNILFLRFLSPDKNYGVLKTKNMKKLYLSCIVLSILFSCQNTSKEKQANNQKQELILTGAIQFTSPESPNGEGEFDYIINSVNAANIIAAKTKGENHVLQYKKEGQDDQYNKLTDPSSYDGKVYPVFAKSDVEKLLQSNINYSADPNYEDFKSKIDSFDFDHHLALVVVHAPDVMSPKVYAQELALTPTENKKIVASLFTDPRVVDMEELRQLWQTTIYKVPMENQDTLQVMTERDTISFLLKSQ